MLTFQELQLELVNHLKRAIRNGELTERGLGRRTGISQPHIHNVLKGKRLFSWAAADIVLTELNLDLRDLIPPDAPPNRSKD